MSSPPRTVAVIDDDPGLLKALSRILRAHGIASDLYASAGEYLAAAGGRRHDGLLIDVELGALSGLDLYRIVRGAGSDTPAVFMSGRPLAHYREQAAALRSGHFLEKPFSAERLLEALGALWSPLPRAA